MTPSEIEAKREVLDELDDWFERGCPTFDDMCPGEVVTFGVIRKKLRSMRDSLNQNERKENESK